MTDFDPKSSVHDEQFGNPENKNEENNLQNSEIEENNPSDEKILDSVPLQPVENEVNDSVSPDSISEESKFLASSLEPENHETAIETIKSGIESEHPEKSVIAIKNESERIDYSKLSKENLVKALKETIVNKPLHNIQAEVDIIKGQFYKKIKSENEEVHQKFIDEGGLPQDFKLIESPVEIQFKELLNKFRELRTEYSKHLEEDKHANLEAKYKIIEEIKELVNSQESMNKTFHEFRDLQNRWRELGPVPQQNVKDLWESYHYQVEAFYDYIKIDKELRDLDLRKNFEAKLVLCEKAEELLIESSVVEAFRKLQILHDNWREIGPVTLEKRTEIWDRFKEATTKINRKHQEYFVTLKQEQKKNFDEKNVLCEKAEEIAALTLDSHKAWEEKSIELIELQKMWKTLGFAPKKFNNEVYERFRKACDTFFEKKRGYYSLNREEQLNNLQLKTELCIQAEALQNSTDWKKTMDELIELQKRWKEIGPVSAKISEKIWKRFRSACDVFFENKSKYYSTIDTRFEENLTQKQALIAEINDFILTDEVEKNLNALKEFQRRWSEIGFVPLKLKTEIQEKYRSVLNSKFDQLRIDDGKKNELKFRNRVDNLMHKPNSQNRLRNEREKFYNKMKQLESDITLWENNIGFFANSKNAESMIADVKNKIESTKAKVDELRHKIETLDAMDE